MQRKSYPFGRGNPYTSNSPRTIIAKYAGKCSCCGDSIPAGAMVDYLPATKQIAHYKGFSGDSQACYSVMCAEMEAKGLPTSRNPRHTGEIIKTKGGPTGLDAGFVDLDRAYEDQCADICGR